MKRRRELTPLNERAWSSPTSEPSKTLDSSLKKNTAFIKRIRAGLNAESQQALLKEIQSLSLEKYLSELVNGVCDGLLKCKTAADVTCAVEVVSALHQRFAANFTPHLVLFVAKGLAPPAPGSLAGLGPDQCEKEEAARVSRQRILLRITVEFWLTSLFRTLDDAGGEKGKATKGQTNGSREPMPLELLTVLLNSDDKTFTNLPLIVSLLKNYSLHVLGSDRDKLGDTEGANGDGDVEDASMVGSDVQGKFRQLFIQYFSKLKVHLIKQHRFIKTQEQRNNEAYVRSGEIFDDRRLSTEKLLRTQEKLVSNMQLMAEALHEDMPELFSKDEEAVGSESLIRDGTSMFQKPDGWNIGCWEDEDQKRFYEDLVDLEIRVPATFLEDGKKGDETKRQAALESALNNQDLEESDEENNEDTSKPGAGSSQSLGAQADALFLKLPNLINRDMIDQFAIDFCNVNSKASRTRLQRILLDVPRSRQDLLPYYSRLVATLSHVVPDLGNSLVAAVSKLNVFTNQQLVRELRRLMHRKDRDLSEVRMRNVRYIGELTKFRVVPQHVIFHVIKLTLDDFSRIGIEFLCNLLENCGRYLYRNAETHKAIASTLGAHQHIMIENAYYFVNPPEQQITIQKERTVEELYARELLFVELNKRSLPRVVKTLRAFHWDEPAIWNMLLKLFSRIWNVRYSCIRYFADLVGALLRFQSAFCVAVVDQLLEFVRTGLEENTYRDNQKRVLVVKYVAELFNARVIDSTVIFDTLYAILTFGHENGQPAHGKETSLDAADDFFRIRLVCAILDTCGATLDKAGQRQKVDVFMAYFQYYMQIKNTLPMEVDFAVQDSFSSLRPNAPLHTSFEAAARALESIMADNINFSGPTQSSTLQNQDIDCDSDEVVEVEDGIEDRESEDSEEPDESVVAGSEEDEELFPIRDFRPEADEEFDREFSRLMSESLESRKYERKAVFDVALPVKRPSRQANFELNEDGMGTPSNMPFTLLSKKGNKQQSKQVDLPINSTLALAMRDKQQAALAEQKRIKSYVLNYERQGEESDVLQMQRNAADRGFKVKVKRNDNGNGVP